MNYQNLEFESHDGIGVLTEDFMEGALAFLQKREAQYRDR